MSIATALKVAVILTVSATSLYVAYRAKVSLTKLRAAKTKTAELAAEGNEAETLAAEQAAEHQATMDNIAAEHEVRIEEVRKKADESINGTLDEVARVNAIIDHTLDILEESLAPPHRLEQLQTRFSKGNNHDRKRKGTGRSSHPRGGKRTDSGE